MSANFNEIPSIATCPLPVHFQHYKGAVPFLWFILPSPPFTFLLTHFPHAISGDITLILSYFPFPGIKTFQMKHCTSDVLHLVFAMWSAVREAKCIFGDHFVAHLHYVWRGDLVLPVACHFKSPSHFYSNRAVCCVLGCYQIQPKVDEQHFVYNLGTLYSSNHIIEIYNSDI